MKEQSENVPPDPVAAGASLPMSIRSKRKRRAALLSICSNSALVIAKIVVGVLTGSVGVLSEAIHSATDLIASLIAFASVRASDNPPDAEHPYGHGKIEGVSGLIEALLIFAAGGYIVFQAIAGLLAPRAASPSLTAGLVVMAISIVMNSLLTRHLKRVGRETDSIALEADAEHLRTDVLTSLGVFIGLLLVRLTHLAWFDPAVGLGVAVLIFHTSVMLARHSMKPLLDARLPPEEEQRIRNILNRESRVLGYHKLRTRKSGSQRHADVHVLIDDDSTLVMAHDLSEELEDRVRMALPDVQINIHIEPYHAEMRHQQEAHGLSMDQANPKSVEATSDSTSTSGSETP